MSPCARTLVLLAIGAASACARTTNAADVAPSSTGPITRAEMEQVRYASLYVTAGRGWEGKYSQGTILVAMFPDALPEH